MPFDRRLIKNIDWPLLAVVSAIVFIGLPVMYSASFAKQGSGGLFAEHLLRLGIGFVFMLGAMVIDYHFFSRYSYVLYVANLAALVYVALSGVIGFGARRWLQIGPVVLQPSEIMKITLILTFAHYFSRLRQAEGMTSGEFSIACLLLLPPLTLILKQPDLGTAGIVCLIFLIMLVVVGISKKTWRGIAKSILAVAVVSFITLKFNIIQVEDVLKPYQFKRIKVLFNPGLDPLGASYHINQSKIAIGSGGVFGKGFLNGTQNQLRFLPQQHTDFIFSVLAEEWGFFGVMVIMLLYLALIFLALQISRDARDRQGSLVALGVAAMIFLHTIINIGMTVGVMPVVGLPLPLMSYGGSSFIVIMIGIGLLLNVRMRRFII